MKLESLEEIFNKIDVNKEERLNKQQFATFADEHPYYMKMAQQYLHKTNLIRSETRTRRDTVLIKNANQRRKTLTSIKLPVGSGEDLKASK